ncbi:dihydrolipoyl dehydrogenase family protein [Hoyosella subflava]|uniref:Dihydrolipoyl dehydrogenase n=1 Tax=Hoyosella subflava (strain DSM 45089 / JCM 17490 / NBRC 109087 / DQS3-9A1) TaxID=443218 RepID=F6EET0_HOYSD|nr:NAD(P)/FAD-dependent oxidoreductase [Hoyosella subflava]AEF40880.1 Dihydrolipoyl dehydrogenase [Hoyosella subflava DQS3-9A1]
MTQDTYDVIVIGGGPAGENAAAYAIAGSNRTAALVERELVGGECSYWACMPSKALLRPAHLLSAAQAMPGVSEGLAPGGLKRDAVYARRDAFVSNHDDASQVQWANNNGIDVIRGSAQLAGERLVRVGDRTLQARHAVVLATGTAASVPDVPGLRAALPWTSRDATNLHELPKRVVIVGGGVVACECATWFAALGAEKVTLLVRGQSLLPKAEPFVGERVADGLRRHGVEILFGTSPQSVDRPTVRDTGEGMIHGGPVTVDLGNAALEADEIVVAAGRAPSTNGLGLATIGIEEGRHVDVDDHMTARDAEGNWLYAVGDVNGRSPLTHMGKYQARVCGDVIAARADGHPLEESRYRATADLHHVPQVVFTAPEVASVGLTERVAASEGYDVTIAELNIAVAGSALSRDDFEGHAKLVVDKGTRCLVGATFVGPDVGELIHAATIAVVGAVPLETLWHAVPSFPTVSEVWLWLLESLRGQ